MQEKVAQFPSVLLLLLPRPNLASRSPFWCPTHSVMAPTFARNMTKFHNTVKHDALNAFDMSFHPFRIRHESSPLAALSLISGPAG